MSAIANPVRGEATIRIAGVDHLLRPSFAALVAAEGELGPLLPLVDRAAEGRIALTEIAALFWHCLAERGPVSRDAVGDAVVSGGLAAAMAPLRTVLQQILAGSA